MEIPMTKIYGEGLLSVIIKHIPQKRASLLIMPKGV